MSQFGYELLISDSPAFTFRYLGEDTNVKLNVAIGDSHVIALPLAQDCLVQSVRRPRMTNYCQTRSRSSINCRSQ